MKRGILLIVFAALVITIPSKSFAWGAKGHAMVAEIAFHFLDDSTKAKVKKYLGNLTIEETANWMDDSRSNSYYDYMRTWHYCDMEKGEVYKPTSERNMLTIIHSALMDLKKVDNLTKKDITRDLRLIFHLIGDLHQPLHCGYSSDKGGNSIEISSAFVGGNLHSVWDTQIIDYSKIGVDDCLKLYTTLSKEEINEINKTDVLNWYKQSRSYLDTAYNFKNNVLDKPYLDNMSPIIIKQLLRGGLRLASVLKQIFNPEKGKDIGVVNFGYGDYFNYYNYVVSNQDYRTKPYQVFDFDEGDDCGRF